MSDDQPKPRFEPPPWETEAFERFQREQEQIRAQAELDAALRATREADSSAQPAEPASPDAAPAEPGSAPSTEQAPAAPAAPVVPEAKIDAMLIQLRGEEQPVNTKPMGLINGVIGFMALSGTYVIIQAVLLFARAQTSDTASTMLAATASFVVFVTGLAFIGGASLLFRKYHT
ncbi:MAG: hypothetical protein U1E29_14330 [Coriobacteriia bacterium]|nr:hypothetical protein [Coriobacteriia bacterium]